MSAVFTCPNRPNGAKTPLTRVGVRISSAAVADEESKKRGEPFFKGSPRSSTVAVSYSSFSYSAFISETLVSRGLPGRHASA